MKIPQQPDPIHNLWGKDHSPLNGIFAPRSIAVIGASERSGGVGRSIMENLKRTYSGNIYPVNPNYKSVLGYEAFPEIGAVPRGTDLALIATPADSVPEVVAACVRAGVPAAIVFSAGFREAGPAGAQLETKVLAEARRGNLRILGPNCLGLMRPSNGLNATFASRIALPGKVALVSQSGALCTSILDWSLKERVGFSAFVSIGSMLDLSWGDFIDYLGSDPETNSILIYMESIGNATEFLSAAREVALNKPIIVLKTGISEAAAQAAASHTGALAGRDEVLDAAFRRVGVLRVHRIAELFLMAEALAKQPRPRGPRLAIVTNAGGPGVLATDALGAAGGRLAELADETISGLSGMLPAAWSHGNPVDILGDADPDRYGRAVDIVTRDPGIDGILVILTPQQMTDPTQTARRLLDIQNLPEKPMLASWMGGAEIAAGEDILNHGGIPTFPYPDTAALIFQYMWQYSLNLKNLYETPTPPPDLHRNLPDRDAAESILKKAHGEGLTLLDEAESKKLLAAYGIPTVPTWVAPDEARARAIAGEIGYPVVLKIYSRTITHKSDVDGVALNLRNAEEVGAAFRRIFENVRKKMGEEHFQGVTVQPMIASRGYELILGSGTDPQFGPVILFGYGGTLVEVFRDSALALPPLTTTLARALMRETRIYSALKGIRGRPPVDLEALAGLLARFSWLVTEQRAIREIDINPLLVTPDTMLALDARVLLQDPKLDPARWPRAALRPYPHHYVWPFVTADGAEIRFRPIRPEDEPRVAAFEQSLSAESVQSRYFGTQSLTQRIRHDTLAKLCFVDYSRQMVLVTETKNPVSGNVEIIGIGHLLYLRHAPGSEFALLLSDSFQQRGIGTELLRRLIHIAKSEERLPVTAVMQENNLAMRRICERLGFQLSYSSTDRCYLARWNG